MVRAARGRFEMTLVLVLWAFWVAWRGRLIAAPEGETDPLGLDGTGAGP